MHEAVHRAYLDVASYPLAQRLRQLPTVKMHTELLVETFMVNMNNIIIIIYCHHHDPQDFHHRQINIEVGTRTHVYLTSEESTWLNSKASQNDSLSPQEKAGLTTR